MDYGHMENRLRVDTCSTEQCAPGHSYGPAVRSYYLIHYVFSGCGRFMTEGKCYELHEGQGFVIFPGVVTTYEADMDAPWHYGWMGFSGTDAAALIGAIGLTRDRPVFDSDLRDEIQAIILKAEHDVASLRMGALSAAGGLLRFLSCIAQTGDAERPADTPTEQYFRKAIWYIEGNLENGVTVTDVADFVGLCRSQLFRIFHAACGIGPQEWILKSRLRRVERLLTSGALSLEEVARSCGFSGTAQMGRFFRRETGMSPGAYRKRSGG